MLLWQPLGSSPVDWQEAQPAAWGGLSAGSPIAALCYQGNVIDGYDHYHVSYQGTKVTITSWVDASVFTPERYARVAVYDHLTPDARFGGAYNLNATVTWYCEGSLLTQYQSVYAGPAFTVLDWSQFSPPSAQVKDGALVSDALWEATQNIRSVRGWREWTAGIPSHLVKNGKLVSQRNAGLWIPPTGTRTYYHRSTTAVANFHSPGNTWENELATTVGVATNVVSKAIGVGGDSAWVAITPVGEPDFNGIWPSDVRRQIDCTVLGSDLVFGLLTLGTGIGHFSRVSSNLAVEVETRQQQEAPFGLPGLSMATAGAWTQTGSQTDRYENLIAAQRTAGHGTQNMTLQLDEADDFTDGGWTAATPEGNLVGFVSNF